MSPVPSDPDESSGASDRVAELEQEVQQLKEAVSSVRRGYPRPYPPT